MNRVDMSGVAVVLGGTALVGIGLYRGDAVIASLGVMGALAGYVIIEVGVRFA